jgi:hypothetical protein
MPLLPERSPTESPWVVPEPPRDESFFHPTHGCQTTGSYGVACRLVPQTDGAVSSSEGPFRATLRARRSKAGFVGGPFACRPSGLLAVRLGTVAPWPPQI